MTKINFTFQTDIRKEIEEIHAEQRKLQEV